MIDVIPDRSQGIEARAILRDSAQVLTGLIEGDFEHFDEMARHEVLSADQIRERDDIWDKYFPADSTQREQVVQVREIFRDGWNLYAESSPHYGTNDTLKKDHESVKAGFDPKTYSDRSSRRFLRRFVFGMYSRDPENLKLNSIMRRTQTALKPALLLSSDKKDGFTLTTVCQQILDGTLPLDQRAYYPDPLSH
ncbi:hypothetical protein A3J15_01995 [Candidatus Roizmanbacteria bacterium RIFCSPLOWO2_02_FULL_38_10]|uniref:Uncharacterized protein n=1 Tax=Candidatus Roizmanbacteria bacterium RIFCSPLOWO2_02_FULL_38_10 TaxID=1802074 RepID=A0A1F7JNC1_9BACT|nr:MAG: hypothetical protein A3J15_01995 [Candidatus Roizmanbacteria bacterium RIFCSPLOWO2_02_FULL_38_10]